MKIKQAAKSWLLGKKALVIAQLAISEARKVNDEAISTIAKARKMVDIATELADEASESLVGAMAVLGEARKVAVENERLIAELADSRNTIDIYRNEFVKLMREKEEAFQLLEEAFVGRE